MIISRRTKIQLVIFAIITLIGGTYVGGRYAQLDRFVIDRTYPVVAQFVDSGGIFQGAPVTYRGIEVGKVSDLQFTDAGVDVTLSIEKSAPDISDDVQAIVANKSAIGEQFVDLQPATEAGPYLRSGSVIPVSRTQIPISTTELLVNVNALVTSLDPQNLKTLVDELGAAFEGTGPDLARILDTSSAFIKTAADNIDVTRELIRGADSALQTQIDEQPALATFSENLAAFSTTLRRSDGDLRALLDTGPESAKTIRTVVDENSADLTKVLKDLQLATEPLARNSTALSVFAILYPYLLEGTYSVVQPSQTDQGEFDARFGLVLKPQPTTCSFAKDGGASSGYRERRSPADLSDVNFDVATGCNVPGKVARKPDNTTVARNRAAAAMATEGQDSWQWLMIAPAVQ